MTNCAFLQWMIHIGLRALPGVFLLVGTFSVQIAAQQHIRAGWVETLLDATETLRNYRGGVAFEDTLRGIHIGADSLHLRVQSDHYVFVRGVAYRDSVRQVRADTLMFSQRERRAEFRGRVFFSDGDRTLQAHQVTYDTQNRQLHAQQGVRFEQTEKKQVLETQFLDYDLNADTGRARGNTRIALSGETADTLVALADSVVFQGKAISLGGNVRIRQKDMDAQAASASYLDSLLLLSGQPLVAWHSKENADSVSGKAERIGFVMDDLKVRAVQFDHKVEIQMATSDSQRTAIWADSARVGLRGDSLSFVQAQQRVRTTLTGKGKEEMALQGDVLHLAFSGGQPDSLILTGNAESTYVPEDGASHSRLRGRQQEMWFRERRLVRVRILDEARCEHRPQRGERVHLSGDFLVLLFGEGGLLRVEADGGVRGDYKEPMP